jgi:hypothetical protein
MRLGGPVSLPSKKIRLHAACGALFQAVLVSPCGPEPGTQWAMQGVIPVTRQGKET